jgi:hypothetical protein
LHADRADRRNDYRELNHDRRQAFNDRQNDGRNFGNHNGWNNQQANTSGDRWNRPSTGNSTTGSDRWNRPATSGNTGSTQQTGTQSSTQGWQNRGSSGGGAQQPATRTAPATTMQAGRTAQTNHYAMASRPTGSFGGARGGRR